MTAHHSRRLLSTLDTHHVYGADLRVDLHLYEPCSDGSVHYGSALTGTTFPVEALSAYGNDRQHPRSAAKPLSGWSVGTPATHPAHVSLLCACFSLSLPPIFTPPAPA